MVRIINAQPNTQILAPHMSTVHLKDADAASFKDFLLNSIHDVKSIQQQADQVVETLMTGGADSAEVLTAVHKADVAFWLMMQMRNKMMEVYREVKDIRV